MLRGRSVSLDAIAALTKDRLRTPFESRSGYAGDQVDVARRLDWQGSGREPSSQLTKESAFDARRAEKERFIPFPLRGD